MEDIGKLGFYYLHVVYSDVPFILVKLTKDNFEKDFSEILPIFCNIIIQSYNDFSKKDFFSCLMHIRISKNCLEKLYKLVYINSDNNKPQKEFAGNLNLQSLAMKQKIIWKIGLNKDIKDLLINNGESSKSHYTEAFESFWQSSIKRGEKAKAYSAWKLHKLDNKAQEMIELLETNYKVKHGANETKYQPHISTWINYRPWEEGKALTEEEVIAKAHEQLQSTKDNLPAKIKNTNPIKSDLERFQQYTLSMGLFININALEIFLNALNDKNIPTHDVNLELFADELQKIELYGLNAENCIKKFSMSSWKSFSIDYFAKEEKKQKGDWFDDPLAPHNLLGDKL
jgi:hypothetical protein